MTVQAYAFERFCYISYMVYLLFTALTNASYFGHLTFWTMMLHSVYFSIDKSSPYAKNAIYLLHGASFAGAMSVCLGYCIICVGGVYRFGSWLTWENAIGKTFGTVMYDRGFVECFICKAFEHFFPPIAAIIDVALSKDVLSKVYAGAAPYKTTLLAVGSYLIFGTTWELTSKGVGKDPLQVYLQPAGFGANSILASMGLDNAKLGLPEDIFFTNFQKLVMVILSFTLYWQFIRPLFGTAPKKGKKA